MTLKHYPNIDSDLSLAKVEEATLKYWQENKIFEKSVNERSEDNKFIFYDGPPFANGLPHYGHLLTGFVKDTVARYKTSKGLRVERRFGWDCHGLPAEMAAEKELNISGRTQITEFGIDKFNNHCKNSVMKYAKYWEDYVIRQGRWVDFENDYKTMDISYMESVLWVFKELYKKNYVYESKRVMPYSWACETPLSNFETKLDNSYREKTDKAITVKFTLNTLPTFLDGFKGPVKLLAWTTTPWTLPANLALAVNEKIEYCYFEKEDEILILASSCALKYQKELGAPVKTFLGAELVGLTYEPILPYFKGHNNAFTILNAAFVEEGSGTGIVHLAPGFGEDDQIICDAHNIELVCPIDSRARFTKEISDYEGRHVFDSIDDIIKQLKLAGSWLKTEQYIHNYPHCWRTDTPLIYRALPSWYVKVTAFKDRMIEANKQINWTPAHIKEGLFGKWLENARDWSISRNRFWGTPIPIWRSDDPKYPRIDVYGSIAELEQDFNTKVTSLHRPHIDSLVRANPDDPTGKSMMRRVEDVFDCWFDSGSMPYGQAHYPFKDKENFDKNFPADFIVEYSAQTRGWFYTLVVLSTAIFDKPPFKNCIAHGVILDDKGQKLSKRLNNYADPQELFKSYGSDALRFFMLSSTVLNGNELLIDKEGESIKETLRVSLKPIWNAYKFFTMYANADEIKAKAISTSDNLLDRYILAKLKQTIAKIELSMDEYNIPAACKAVNIFVEILNNWYIRRNRSRFWKTEQDEDKFSAYNTLFTVLGSLVKATSSLLPMLSEEIYLGLNFHNNKLTGQSVHLELFPNLSDIADEYELIEQMDIVRDICSATLAIRNNTNIRIRQPLSHIVIFSELNFLNKFEDLIKEEINVKEVKYASLKESTIKPSLKINFPVVGKRIPHKIKDIIAAQKNQDWAVQNSQIVIAGETLLPTEAELHLECAGELNKMGLHANHGVVELDINITDALKYEGLARDIIRMIQQARKDADLEINEKIIANIVCQNNLHASLKPHFEFIEQQTLAKIVLEDFAPSLALKVNELHFEEAKITIGIKRV
jgi:isoleucyl-tRNA synthetase